MNKFNINEDAYFISYKFCNLYIECMKIKTILASKDGYICYDGFVYEIDPDTAERYINKEFREETRMEYHLFKSKNDALVYLKNKIAALEGYLNE